MHFLLPILILVLVLFHLIFLHETGSSRRLFTHSNESKMKFNFSFSVKDGVNIFFFSLFFLFCFINPYTLGDPENFIFANPIISPLHIKPEWYFLFAYAILRSVPNKLGGVLALIISVIIFYFFRFFKDTYSPQKNFFKVLFWFFLITFIVLTWLGGNPVEVPYIFLRQLFSFLYFIFIILYFLPNIFFM